jgi:hypothetical protein
LLAKLAASAPSTSGSAKTAKQAAQPSRIRNPERVQCFNCSAYGHFVQECPKPADQARINHAREAFATQKAARAAAATTSGASSGAAAAATPSTTAGARAASSKPAGN